MGKIINADQIYTQTDLDEFYYCRNCDQYYDSPADIDEDSELCEDCKPEADED